MEVSVHLKGGQTVVLSVNHKEFINFDGIPVAVDRRLAQTLFYFIFVFSGDRNPKTLAFHRNHVLVNDAFFYQAIDINTVGGIKDMNSSSMSKCIVTWNFFISSCLLCNTKLG